jgi:hypothetical protein
MYLEGMEGDESVPLVVERREEAEGMPDSPHWTEREVEGASVISITGMLSDLETARGAR